MNETRGCYILLFYIMGYFLHLKHIKQECGQKLVIDDYLISFLWFIAPIHWILDKFFDVDGDY
jgi:hypothetical protein